MRTDVRTDLDRPSIAAVPAEDGRARSRGLIWAALSTGAVLASAFAGAVPLRDAETLAAATGVSLVYGPGYLLMAPVLALLDTLTLLTMSEHYAMLATAIAAFAAWRLARTRRPRRLLRRTSLELGAAALGLLALAALYGFGMLVDRPMARLVADHPDDVIIDFHSHTNASWDTRGSFDVERNRRWHRDAGFHVAYISDHRTFTGAIEAEYSNPVRAGDGTTLLSAVEVVFANRHVNALGHERRYDHLIHEGRISIEAADAAIGRGEPDPMLVLPLPASLDWLRAAEPGVRAGIWAIELVDGAPRGLEQGRRERARLLEIADSLDLAVIAGSNNHGWGRTSAAWSIMRIPKWRELHPDSLASLIEHGIRTERRNAVRVVERRHLPPSDSRSALALTVPGIAWQMLGNLSPAERAAWIAWIWALALIVPTLHAGFLRRLRIRFT